MHTYFHASNSCEQPAALIPVSSAGRQGARRQLLRWQLVAAGEPSTVAPSWKPYPPLCQYQQCPTLATVKLLWSILLSTSSLAYILPYCCFFWPVLVVKLNLPVMAQSQYNHFSKLRWSEKKSAEKENGWERQEQVMFASCTRTNCWGWGCYGGAGQRKRGRPTHCREPGRGVQMLHLHGEAEECSSLPPLLQAVLLHVYPPVAYWAAFPMPPLQGIFAHPWAG